MMNVLDFIFQDGWHYFGFLILLYIAAKWRPTLFYIDKSVDNSIIKSKEDNE